MGCLRWLLPLSLVLTLACGRRGGPPPRATVPVDAYQGPSFVVEGYGRLTAGGRGGRIIDVVTLADDGRPGTLRAAVAAQGPRIVRFRVGGIIHLTRELVIEQPFLTIDGSSAPAPGITIRGALTRVKANEVILHQLRFRLGLVTGYSIDTLAITGAENVVIDHCSLSWAVDDNLSLGGYGKARNITVQWSLFAEPLFCQACSKNNLVMKYETERVTLHHNLFLSAPKAPPRLSIEKQTWRFADIEFVNNAVIGYETAPLVMTAVELDLIGNVFSPLAKAATTAVPTLTVKEGIENVALFLEDNLAPERPDPTQPEAALAGTSARFAVKRKLGEHNIAREPARSLIGVLTTEVGATRPCRDRIDARLLADIAAGAGKVIEHEREVGGFAGSVCAPVEAHAGRR